jgi:predicted secreted protein
MVAVAGRQVTFLWGDDSPQVEIPGVREKGIELNGEPIDITSDEDDGWRTLLTIAGENQVNISINGVTKNARLKNDWFAGASSTNRMQALTLIFPDGATLTGTFFMASFKETASYKDAMTFEATLNSSGTITYTPGSPA